MIEAGQMTDIIVALESVNKVKEARLLRAKDPAILRIGTNVCAPWIPNNAIIKIVSEKGGFKEFRLSEIKSFEIHVPKGTYNNKTKEIVTDQKR